MEPIFYEIFEQLHRLGPGSNEFTRRAYKAIQSDSTLPHPLNVLDIGCGTGIHTLELASLIDGKITSMDNHQPFLDKLQNKLTTNRLKEKIQCVKGDMNAMEFPPQSYDLIWSEGAIFITGFEKGIKEWKQFLKPGGYVALTDAFWLKPNPPEEVKAFWDTILPGFLSREQAIQLIEQNGYEMVHHFNLPESAWWDVFYHPLEDRLKIVSEKYTGNPDAENLISSLYHEIDMYRKYSEYYGYVFLIFKLKE